MLMKPQNLLRSMLLFPYILWVLTLALTTLLAALSNTMDPVPPFLNVLVLIPAFYTVGIIGWGIPYTLLAVGLLVWSFKKSVRAMFTAFVLAPILLAILTLIEMSLLVFSPSEYSSFPANGEDIFFTLLFSIVPPILFGYFLVGLGFFIYKTMERRHWLQPETAPTPEQIERMERIVDEKHTQPEEKLS